jgi:hypothetical protein
MSKIIRTDNFYSSDEQAMKLISVSVFKGNMTLRFSSLIYSVIFFVFIFAAGAASAYSQVGYQPNYFIGNQPNNNYLANSTAFRQEVARVEINVLRNGKEMLPITQVPRLEKDDVLKVRLLEEQVNGMRIDQSNWNWTFVVAYINPARNNEREKAVSEEIQFRKTGWYKEYSFVVPYDSQPIFFLYSKPNYRKKVLNLITKNQEEIRKIGEKTLELSNAYANISAFLNELQFIVNRTSYGYYGGYGGAYGNPYGGAYGNNNTAGYGYYGSYGSYGSYGTTSSFNINLFMEQTIERLARSFNIQLPQCWQGGGYGYGSYGSYGSYGNQNGFMGISQDFVSKSQCVARSIRLEDFDVSVSRMLQQGGMMVAAQLTQKYPQLTFWINVAAAALDFILKLTKKSPLRIVPTVTSTSDNPAQNFGYQNNFPAAPNSANIGGRASPVKISLFAEAPPNDNGFVTAYPLVIHKWQANPDPEVISLPTPVLMDQCLHTGQNILKTTDVLNDWMSDAFTKDFQLVISSPNGFRKEFPLKKNVGLGGWELSLTKEDLNSFPKINMTLESVVTGKRGFNEIRSPKFDLPLPINGTWEVKPEAQKAFAVGGKRLVTIRNQLGSCKCLQAVVYKPSFGGQFVFEANSKVNPLLFSEDGKEVSFEIDVTGFQPGQGQLELRQYGGDVSTLEINLYPPPPMVSDLKISNGDNRAIISGERIEQIQAVKINGKRMIIEGNNQAKPVNNPNFTANLNQSDSASKSGITFVFENPTDRLTSNAVSLELELEDNRVYQYPKIFKASLARPTLISGSGGEIEATAINVKNTAKDISDGKINQKTPPISLDLLPVFPIEASELSVNVQNALTDYDFKAENIQIETRIENSELNPAELPKVEFEVLDWKNMRINFSLSESLQKLLGGRRLQFRIRDIARGNSNWYTLQKTFVRTPEQIAVRCANQTSGNCEMTGKGIEYIRQVSVDGGKTWYPQEPATLMPQLKPDGQKAVIIPFYSNKKLLQIRLRDFPGSHGLTINDYSFSNAARRKN